MVRKKRENNEQESIDKQLRRKMAEQLAEKVGASPEEIEKGVGGFIQRSSESLGGRPKPPYRRPSWYEDFFDIIKQRTIDNFSLEFIRLNIASGSEAYKVRSGLRFLELIDEKGHPTPKLLKLRVTGEEFKKNLGTVILDAYSDLFKSVVMEKARPESVINFMIERYGYSRPLAEEATALFVYFCSKAGIALSSELSEFQVLAKETPRQISPRKISKPQARTRGEEDGEGFAASNSEGIYRFAVKKDLASIDFARNQVNTFLDYWKKKILEESSKE